MCSNRNTVNIVSKVNASGIGKEMRKVYDKDVCGRGMLKNQDSNE